MQEKMKNKVDPKKDSESNTEKKNEIEQPKLSKNLEVLKNQLRREVQWHIR